MKRRSSACSQSPSCRVIVAEHGLAVLQHEGAAALHQQLVVRGGQRLPILKDLCHVGQAQRGDLERALVPHAKGLHSTTFELNLSHFVTDRVTPPSVSRKKC